MRIVRLSLSLSILSALSLGAPYGVAFAKSKKEQTKPVSFEKRAEQITKNFTRSMKRHGVPLLTFEQAMKLEYWNRVRYLEQLRKTIASLESIQRRFGVRIAANSIENNELWALFVGDNAFAQDCAANPGLCHDRGRQSTDTCIYAMHIVDYKQGGGAYQCNRPESFRCHSPKNGSGYSCNFIGSGLTGEDACIPEGKRKTATTECANRASALRAANHQRVGELIKEFKALIESKGNKITALTQDEMNTWAKKLSEAAYDERAFAHLMGLAYAADKTGRKIPLPQVDSLAEEFNKTSALVDDVFAKFNNHCNKKLTDRVIDEIEQQSARPKSDIERRRGELLAQYGREGATVRNVLQNEECSALDARQAAISREIGAVIATLDADNIPQYEVLTTATGETIAMAQSTINDGVGAPTPLVPSQPQVNPNVGSEPNTGGTQPGTPPTTIPVREDTNICGGPADLAKRGYESTKINEGAYRCLICPAERDVNDKVGISYTTSKKWFALLAIMSKKCGDSKGVSQPVNLSTALNYMHTFGHCSSSLYEFSGNMSPSLERKIRQWQVGEGLSAAKKDKEFESTFGADMDTMTDIFCNDKQAEKRFVTNSPKYWAQRRLSAKQEFDTKYHKSRNRLKTPGKDREGKEFPDPTGFLACFKAAHENAARLYDSTSGMCRGLVKVNDPAGYYSTTSHTRPLVAEMAAGGCYNSYAISGEKPEVLFTMPGDINTMVRYDTTKHEFVGGTHESSSLNSGKISAIHSKYCPDSSTAKDYYIPNDSRATN